ncbi:MAG: MlaD family protein [Rhodocyclaceae bacterium]
MENRAHAILAGLFVLVLGAATVGAVWWFSGEREATRTLVLVSRGSITGLNLQAAVRYRGISAGRVESIAIDQADPQNILVRVSLRTDLPVTQGTTASLGYQGVTGLAFIQLDDRGTDPRPLVGEGGEPPRIALSSGLLDELSSVAVQALDQFRKIAAQVERVFDEKSVARVEATMTRLESAVKGMDETFAAAPEVLAEARRFLTPENRQHLTRSLANLSTASEQAGPTLVELRGLLIKLQDVSDHIDQTAIATGDGLLNGTLPRLNGLMKELTVTSQRLTRLIEEVDASPQMLLLGRGAQAPGPGEQGFAVPSVR